MLHLVGPWLIMSESADRRACRHGAVRKLTSRICKVIAARASKQTTPVREGSRCRPLPCRHAVLRRPLRVTLRALAQYDRASMFDVWGSLSDER
jgi:hypothetical protein